MNVESNPVQRSTFNPKKYPEQRRKRNPLPKAGDGALKVSIMRNPATKKSYIVQTPVKAKSPPCKSCGLRSRVPGSSRCQECSNNK